MSMDLYTARVSPPAPGKPLIFALHGTGGDETQLFNMTGQIAPGAGVVSPRGDVLEGGAARFFRRTGEGIYDMDDLRRATEKMRAFVDAHRAAHPDTPVYAYGYSNGANILASVFMEHPELFDRIALLHPLVTWDAEYADGIKGKRVLITGGQHDPIAPLGMTQALIRWFEQAGADVQSDIHTGGHELRNSELAALQSLLSD